MSVRIAVLGAGRIGQVHASAVASVPEASLVADPVVDAAASVATKFECEIRTIEEIETAADIDAVVICTATDTHAGLIERFCRASKAVFCENLIDLSLEQVKKCLGVVIETNGTLMIGFQRRFDPDFRALKSKLDDGTVGNVEMVTLTSQDPGPPALECIERSSGIFRDMTIHDFDVARWLSDEEVATEQAAATVQVDHRIGELGDYDSVNVIMTTASGKHCTITNSRRATYGYDQRIEVHGSGGSVSAENHRESRIEIADVVAYCRPPLLNFFMTRYAVAYATEISAFVKTVQDGGPVPIPGEDGLSALALAEAALKSVAEQRVVRIEEVLD
jgi:myo-inositol 2-dehydrogenase/D-chiro-inositol 1-dehydrogenase